MLFCLAALMLPHASSFSLSPPKHIPAGRPKLPMGANECVSGALQWCRVPFKMYSSCICSQDRLQIHQNLTQEITRDISQLLDLYPRLPKVFFRVPENACACFWYIIFPFRNENENSVPFRVVVETTEWTWVQNEKTSSTAFIPSGSTQISLCWGCNWCCLPFTSGGGFRTWEWRHESEDQYGRLQENPHCASFFFFFFVLYWCFTINLIKIHP